jgi:small-conductance mechanosensitive channel
MAAAAAGTASPAPAALSSFKRNLQQQHSNCSELGLNSSHVANLMERVQQLRSGAAATSAAGGTTTTTTAAAAATTTKHKLQDMMILQGFSMAPPPPCAYSPDPDMMNLGNVINDISLEEEEKSLQYIEVSLQEVSREVQRRKDELRNKRRRLLEDEARMHNIIFQSSSWIENSMSGRISL